MTNRIGFRQALILAAVARNPGSSILELDRQTNSGRRHALTYNSVHRLWQRGLVRLIKASGRAGYCVLPGSAS